MKRKREEGRRPVFPRQEALKKKKVIFIGDSLTRYQYLSFTHYLTFGQYPNPSDNWANEREWPGWTEFYNGTNRVLNSTPKSSEICDCYRNQNTPLDQIIENRKYSGIIDVYYFQFFRRDISMKGHVNFATDPAQVSCTPGECGDKPTWELSLVDALERVVKPLKPDIVIVNAGLHESSKYWDQSFMDSFLDIMDQFPLPIWKTTTKRKEEDHRPDTDDRMLATILLSQRRMVVFDAFSIAAISPFNETWDSVHFFSPTYELLNQKLLELFKDHGQVLPAID